MAKKVEIKIGLQQNAFQRGIGKVKRGLTSLVTKARSAAGMFGIAMGGAAMVAGLKNLVDELDNIGKTAQRIGVTTDAMQKLKIASELSGNSINTIQTAFKRMSAVVYDAQRGLKDANDSIGALGLSIDDFSGKNTEQMFEMITIELRKITNESQKSALAQKIFGRSGQELIPLINNYKEIAKEAENAGSIISESAIRKAEKFNDDLTKFNAKAKSTVVGIGGGLLNIFNDSKDAIQGLTDILVHGAGVGERSIAEATMKRISAENAVLEEKEKQKRQIEENAKAQAKADKAAEKALKKQMDLNDKLNLEILRRSGGNLEKISAEANGVMDSSDTAEKEAYIQNLNEKEQIFADSMARKEEEILIQQTLAKGLEREAGLYREQFDLRRSMGRNLNSEEMKILSEKYDMIDYIKTAKKKELLDEKNKQELERQGEALKKKAISELEKSAQEEKNGILPSEKVQGDRFSKMGLQIGGAVPVIDEKTRSEKRNQLLTQINENLKNQKENLEVNGVIS